MIDREDDGSVVGEDAVKFSEDRCPVGYVVQDEGRDDYVLTRVRDEGEGLGKVGNENVASPVVRARDSSRYCKDVS